MLISTSRRWRHRSSQFDPAAVTHAVDVSRTAAVRRGTSTSVGSREDGKMKQGRRVASRDKISSRRGTSGFAVAAPSVGDDFPCDDFALDDLPVRDVSEDQQEPQPAPHVRTKGATRPVHPLNEGITGRGGEGVATAPAYIEKQTSTSALGQEPTLEPGAPTPQVDTDHPKQPVQGCLPGLEPDKDTGFDSSPMERQALRSRGRRAPARDKRSKATQMELWPDDPTSIARAEPFPPNSCKG
jgi:hypothetical protein